MPAFAGQTAFERAFDKIWNRDKLTGVWLAGFHRFFWGMDDKMGYFMVFGGGSTMEQAFGSSSTSDAGQL